ncbi:MAG: hypothetical protein ABJB12_20765 [Pseudomonadota bacterium]
MRSKSVRCVACLVVGLACGLPPRQARAWEATQVTLQATALSYEKFTFKPDGGGTASSSTSVTDFGLFGSGMGAGVGYAWDNVGLGVRASIQNISVESRSVTTLSLFPRLEYQANPGATGAFVAALLGVTHSSADNSSSTLYGFGGALGVHGFVDPAVSIDPELTVMGLTGSQSVSGTGFLDQGASQSGVQVLLTLGLSGWITGRHAPPRRPPPVEETAPATPRAVTPDDEDEAEKPVYTSIHLPGHRQLYLQVSKNPARTSLIVRLAEPRTEAALAACDDISVLTSTGPLRLRVRVHGDHFVAGRLPLRAAELLAASDAVILVCGAQWQLGQESRELIQAFLNNRSELLENNGDEDVPVPAPPTPGAPQPAAPNQPATAPSAAVPPAAAPPAAAAPRAPTAPKGTFAPVPPPAQPAAPKK